MRELLFSGSRFSANEPFHRLANGCFLESATSGMGRFFPFAIGYQMTATSLNQPYPTFTHMTATGRLCPPTFSCGRLKLIKGYVLVLHGSALLKIEL